MSVESMPADTVERTTGLFIYGLVPGDVEPTEDARGVGDPPAAVDVVTYGEIAALVSDVPLNKPLGRPDDLRAYKALLDGVTTAAPVLPVRFGTVAQSRDAVEDLLAAQHDDYLRALDRLEGRTQYVVRARYVERIVLSEVLAGNQQASALRDQLQGQPEDATRDVRMRLGEIINGEIEARRAADSQRLINELAAFCAAEAPRQPTHELDAAHAAFLVEPDRQADFEGVVERIGAEWGDRATVKLLGPMAAYDFVDQLTAPE